jgi:hypothetical protein
MEQARGLIGDAPGGLAQRLRLRTIPQQLPGNRRHNGGCCGAENCGQIAHARALRAYSGRQYGSVEIGQP